MARVAEFYEQANVIHSTDCEVCFESVFNTNLRLIRFRRLKRLLGMEKE